MDELEMIVLVLSGFLSFKFLVKLYRTAFTQWPPNHNKAGRNVLGFLPVVSFVNNHDHPKNAGVI